MMRSARLQVGFGSLLAAMIVPAGETPSPAERPCRQPIPLVVAGSSEDSGFAVCADGSVRLEWWGGTGVFERESTSTCTWHFALPAGPPMEDRWEAPGSPFRLMVWEQAGVRYTQTFLVTSLEPDEPPFGPPSDSPLVGLVHLKGENTNSEYTDAFAGLGCLADGLSCELKLDLGIVYRREGGSWVGVGGIDVPTEGIQRTNGPALAFHGHMPPGLSGGMTFKLLLSPIATEVDLEKLRNLDFDQEYRRVRRRWQESSRHR